jgi:hypothetical protein
MTVRRKGFTPVGAMTRGLSRTVCVVDRPDKPGSKPAPAIPGRRERRASSGGRAGCASGLGLAARRFGVSGVVGQLSGECDVLGDVAQFAMQMLAGGAQLVEGLVWGAELAGGENADSDADLPVAVQRDLQVFGVGLVGGVEQREGGVASEDRAEGEVEISEHAGLTGVKLRAPRWVPSSSSLTPNMLRTPVSVTARAAKRGHCWSVSRSSARAMSCSVSASRHGPWPVSYWIASTR